MARYARRAQAAQDATATAPDSPRGVGAGPDFKKVIKKLGKKR